MQKKFIFRQNVFLFYRFKEGEHVCHFNEKICTLYKGLSLDHHIWETFSKKTK